MNLTMRDRIATLLVAIAALIYGLWLTGVVAGLSTSAVALAVLGLGVLASASAVVPGFGALLRGSRAYLGMASLLGLVAFVSGILTVVNATSTTLTVLVAVTLVLWAVATIRHRSTVDERRVAA